MASNVKDYIVRYDIQASVANATSELGRLSKVVTEMTGPFQSVKQSMTDIASRATNLRSALSEMVFAPKLDFTQIDKDLTVLKGRVTKAASEIRTALNEALSGKGTGAKVAITDNSKAAAATTGKKATPLTNLTPATIKAWEKAFGNTKGKSLSLTVSAVDNATSVINGIKESMTALSSMGTFTITPNLNAEAFAAAEAKIKTLVGQASAIVKPTSATTTAKGKGKGKTTTTAKGKGTTAGTSPMVVEATAQVTKVTIAATPPVVQLTGEITKITNAVTEAIPVNVKVMASQVSEALKAIPKPQINAYVKLGWENGAIGKSKQLKDVQNKLPPVTLKLDISKATASLEELIAKIKAASPQTIMLNTSTTAGGGSTTGSSTTTSSGSSGTTNTVLTGGSRGDTTTSTAKMSEQEKKLLAMRENAKKLGAKQLADNKLRLQKGQEYATQQASWYTAHQNYLNNLFNRYFNRYDQHLLKPDYGWAERAQAARNAELATMRADAIAAFSKPSVNEPDYGWVEREQAARNAELAAMRRDAMAAFAKPTPYEIRQAKKMNQPVQEILKKQNAKLQAMRSSILNAAAPFITNKGQAEMLIKNRKFFQNAIKQTGITLTPQSSPQTRMTFFNAVSSSMNAAGVGTPWQLQQEINKAARDIARQTNAESARTAPMYMGKGSVGRIRPFDEKMRKWSYPFTGSTSLGAKSPMALEMAKGIGVMYAIGGAMSAIGSSFSQAMEYQHTMQTTNAILQNGTDTYTKDGFDNMERIIRNVGIKTKFSAPEVASASRFLAMAGYDINAINNAIRPIADIALIGNTDLGETADKMTNIMTTFGIKPEKMREVANIMATTATRSNTDLMMLAESAKYGGGVANLYGRGNPNLFADTMALFGVMGNAGIQASSAGTALRMMYQNIFKPNKKQKEVIAQLKGLGIETINPDGSYRAMSDIILDMAQKVPDKDMPGVVGNLFRITAQPGAGAALLAAAGGNKLLAQELLSTANETGTDDFSRIKDMRGSLSALASLMLANRQSAKSSISNNIAEEMQNTLSGLWAQVTSTFTEGIVKAFDQRKGGFAEMLKGLRDYFAKPQTVTLLKNILDIIVEIGKALAWFAKIWVSIYSMFPGMTKAVILLQLMFSQFGALLLPFSQLINVVGKFKQLLFGVAGANAASGTFAGVRALAGGAVVAKTGSNMANALSTAPLIIGTGSNGKNIVLKGAIAARARSAMAQNAITAAVINSTPAVVASHTKYLNDRTRAHYMAVTERARSIYSTGKIKRGFAMGMNAGFGVLSLASLRNTLFTLFGGLSTVIGLLINPITILTASFGGLGYAVYKVSQIIKGETDAQILAVEKLAEQSGKAYRTMRENFKWYDDFVAKYQTNAGTVTGKPKTQMELEYDRNSQRFRDEYADFFGIDLSKDASYKNNENAIKSFNNRIDKELLYQLALGEYDKSFGIDDYKKEKQKFNVLAKDPDSSIDWYGLVMGARDEAQIIQKKQISAILRTSGASSPALAKVIQNITDLYQQYGLTNRPKYLKEANKVKLEYFKQMDGIKFLDSSKLTVEQAQQITDPSQYQEYWIGQKRIINSFINGAVGTRTGAIEANNWLQNVENKRAGLEKIIGWQKLQTEGKLNAGLYKSFVNRLLDQQTNTETKSFLEEASGKTLEQAIAMRNAVIGNRQEWKNNIAKIIGEYSITFHALSPTGDLLGVVNNLSLRMKNGVIDQAHVLEQIRTIVKNYNLDLTNFSTIIGQVYIAMAKAGVIAGDKNSLWGYMWSDQKNMAVTATDAETFYKNKGKSDQFRNGISMEEFVGFATSGNNNQKKLFGNKYYTPAGLRQEIRRTLGLRSLSGLMGGLTSVAPNVTDTNNGGGDGNGGNSTINQDPYAMAYNGDMAKPTQVVFNFDSFARFDRTSVAANADEQDLMATIEEKIANVVYQVVAQSVNNAQNIGSAQSLGGAGFGSIS